MFKKILVAVDSSEPASRAAAAAVELAGKIQGRVLLLTVTAPSPTFIPDVSRCDAEAEQNLERAKKLLTCHRSRIPENLQVEEIILSGQPEDEIIAAARTCHADLIVLGTHSRQGLARMVLGSTAEAVVRRSPCVVMVVPPGADVAHSPEARVSPPCVAAIPGQV